MQTALWVWSLGADGAVSPRLRERRERARHRLERRGDHRATPGGGAAGLDGPAAVDLRAGRDDRRAASTPARSSTATSASSRACSGSKRSRFRTSGSPIDVRERHRDGARPPRAAGERRRASASAFHAASVGMALTTLDGNFVQVNDRLARDARLRRRRSCPRSNVRDVTHTGRHRRSTCSRSRSCAPASATRISAEKRYVRKDGSVLWGDLTVSLVRGLRRLADARRVARPGHHRPARGELALRATFEHSVVPMLVADDERRLVDLNEAAAELLGVSHEEATRAARRRPARRRAGVPELWRGFLRDGTWEAKVSLRRPDGGVAPDRVRRDRRRAPRTAHRRRARPDADDGARVSAAAGAEDGSGRPPRRRHRPRLQQPA